MNSAEAVVKAAFLAFPEVFPPDTHREYEFDWETVGRRWFGYGVMPKLRGWVEERLDLTRVGHVAILAGGHDRLERYFSFVEPRAAAASSDLYLRDLIAIEVFLHTTWTEQVLAGLESPHGRQWKVRWPAIHELLKWAQGNWPEECVGRWPD